MTLAALLVEDAPPAQRLLEGMLAALGHFKVVACCTTQDEAVEWLAAHPGGWDLAIVDLVLAQGTGMRVIAEAARLAPQGRIAVFSDYVTPRIEQLCQQLGAQAVFRKGDQFEALRDWCAVLGTL